MEPTQNNYFFQMLSKHFLKFNKIILNEKDSGTGV